MRAVLDPNVLVSSLISASGPPRMLIEEWVRGRFELVVSPALLGELRDVLGRDKFRRWVSASTATDFIDGLEEAALVIDDPPAGAPRLRDPDDDYLLDLCRAAEADCLVSGDGDLHEAGMARLPVLTPRWFPDRLAGG